MQKLPNKPSPNVDVVRVFYSLYCPVSLPQFTELVLYLSEDFFFLITVKDMGRTSKKSKVSIIKEVLFISALSI